MVNAEDFIFQLETRINQQGQNLQAVSSQENDTNQQHLFNEINDLNISLQEVNAQLMQAEDFIFKLETRISKQS